MTNPNLLGSEISTGEVGLQPAEGCETINPAPADKSNAGLSSRSRRVVTAAILQQRQKARDHQGEWQADFLDRKRKEQVQHILGSDTSYETQQQYLRHVGSVDQLPDPEQRQGS